MFDGPRGSSSVWESVAFDDEHPLLERVAYEVTYGAERHGARTLGEAAIVACELVGDDRFSQPILPTHNSPGSWMTRPE